MPLSPVLLGRRVRSLDAITRLESRAFVGRVFLVGGALRELALGHVPKDYDFALEREEDIAVFEEIFGARSFLLGKKPIQTRRIVTPDVSIDVTDLEGTIEDDLFRRDFTVNAMAYDLARHEILDILGGIDDVTRRLIRYPRRQSLQEDPLRMIKAMRHLASLTGFSLDADVKAAISANKELIHSTAPERIKYELDLIMVSRAPHKAIDAMRETGLLFELFPELSALGRLDKEKGLKLETLGHTLGGFHYMGRVRRFHPLTEEELKYAGYGLLLHDLGKPLTFSMDGGTGKVHFFHHERLSRDLAAGIMDRLRFSASETRSILCLIENHMRIFLISTREATERATRRLVYKMEDLSPVLVHLTLLDLYGSSKGRDNTSTRVVRQRCREVLAAHEEWSKAPLPRLITGGDLLALGFREGPLIGRILNDIRERQIAGEMTKKDDALEWAWRRGHGAEGMAQRAEGRGRGTKDE